MNNRTIGGKDSSDFPVQASLDTPEIIAALKKAQAIAGNDKSLNITLHKQPFDAEAYVEPVKLFDNLYYIGSQDVGTFIFTTTEGLIMIDSCWNNMTDTVLIPGMKKAGLDPAKVKYMLITHAGPDHIGAAQYFQKNYGTHILMQTKEWDKVSGVGVAVPKNVSPRPSMRALVWPDRDMNGIDGQKLTLGDTTITMVHTPRQVNSGGLSFITTVYDNGVPHVWSTYGNTGIVGALADKQVYRDSIAHVLKFVDAVKADVVICDHPWVDGSIARWEILKNRKSGEPNPFVLGQERTRRYYELLDLLALISILRETAGLDDTGTKRLAQ